MMIPLIVNRKNQSISFKSHKPKQLLDFHWYITSHGWSIKRTEKRHGWCQGRDEKGSLEVGMVSKGFEQRVNESKVEKLWEQGMDGIRVVRFYATNERVWKFHKIPNEWKRIFLYGQIGTNREKEEIHEKEGWNKYIQRYMPFEF